MKFHYQKLVIRGRKMTGYGRGGYDRGDFGFCRAKPVEVGKEHDVTIPAIIERGDGIARIQGFVIFVAGPKAGEHLKIKLKLATGSPRPDYFLEKES